MSEKKILIASNDKPYLQALEKTLQASGYQVTTALNSNTALEALQTSSFGLFICEEKMRPMDGIDLLKTVQTDWPKLPVVLFTDHGTIERAVQAMRKGAKDYLVKPINSGFLQSLASQLITTDEVDTEQKSGIVAQDPHSQELLRIARRVSAKDVSVLISGESGTGKEVLAQFIHDNSPRHDKPLVAINCAAIPENMLEAVLFGYEQGAFAGALHTNVGKFEKAHGGTLLLDEISEMNLSLQAKLLRVLQEHEIERLGGNKIIELDVRVLATTNRDLREAVANGNFREDLYYRLNVFPLKLSPLRERPADIVPLALQMIRRHTPVGQIIPTLSEEAATRLIAWSWPGNVRELGNVIQRALILCAGDQIEAEDLRYEQDNTPSQTQQLAVDDNATLSNNLKSHEYDLILQALNSGQGSRKTAAEILGISPRTLRYKIAKMRKMGLEIPLA